MTDPVLTAGRVAVVTGAAMGIGLAACWRFARLGMKVCMVDVDAEGLQAAHVRLVDAPPDGEETSWPCLRTSPGRPISNRSGPRSTSDSTRSVCS